MATIIFTIGTKAQHSAYVKEASLNKDVVIFNWSKIRDCRNNLHLKPVTIVLEDTGAIADPEDNNMQELQLSVKCASPATTIMLLNK